MGRPVHMNMMEVYGDYYTSGTASSRTRKYRRLAGNGIASPGAIEGRSLTDHGAMLPGISRSDRPQRDAGVAVNWRASRTKAVKITDSLASRLMRIGKTVKEGLATSKPLPPARTILRPTTRDLEDVPLCLVDVNADAASLSTQQEDDSQHTSDQELSPSASPSRPDGFKKTLIQCTETLKRMVEEALGWSECCGDAGIYFDLVATNIEQCRFRLHQWGSDDIKTGEPNFDDSSPSDLMEYVKVILEGIMSAAKDISEHLVLLGSLAFQDTVGPTGDETETEESVEELGKKVNNLDPPASQQDLKAALKRKIYIWNTLIESQSEEIGHAVETLNSLSKALHLHKANADQKGLLVGRRQELFRIGRQVEARTGSQEHHTKTKQGEPATQVLDRMGNSTWYSEDEDDYDDDDHDYTPTTTTQPLSRISTLSWYTEDDGNDGYDGSTLVSNDDYARWKGT